MEARPRARKRLPWWVVGIFILTALIVYLAAPRPVEVQGARVRPGVLFLNLSSTGIVEGTVSDVSSRLTARVVRLYAEEGDTVSKGQALAQLEQTDIQAEVARLQATVAAAEQQAAALEHTAQAEAAQLAAAEARARANLQAARENLRLLEAGARPEDIASQRAVVAQARAQAEEASRSYERAQQLHANGAISAQRLDQTRAASLTAASQLEAQEQVLRKLEAGPREQEVRAAKAQVAAVEAALREAQAARGGTLAREREAAAAQDRVREARAALVGARAQQEFTVIRSPVSGVVARKHKEIGEVASPFEPLYTVADLRAVWVTAEVDEEDVAAVAPGQRVTITLDAFPGREAAGVVTRVASVAEPKEVGRVRAKVLRAKIILERSSIPLRVGMEVNVNGRLPAGSSTLLVPNDAVIRIGDLDSVYVITRGIARRRRVTTGQSNFEDTQIIAGLRPGEMVAISHLDALSDGARVTVRNRRQDDSSRG